MMKEPGTKNKEQGLKNKDISKKNAQRFTFEPQPLNSQLNNLALTTDSRLETLNSKLPRYCKDQHGQIHYY